MVFVGWFSVDRCFNVVKRLFGRIQGSRNLCKSRKDLGEKRVRKSYAELNENGAQIGPRNRQHFEKYQKKGIPKTIRKKSAERNRLISVWVASSVRLVSNFGLAGGRGVQFWFKFLIQRAAPS